MADSILHRIRGADVARAQNSLPPAETSAASTIDAVIDVADHGAVRITFARIEHKRHRTRRVFWVADRAVLVGPECQPR
jgi:hypothetical protein